MVILMQPPHRRGGFLRRTSPGVAGPGGAAPDPGWAARRREGPRRAAPPRAPVGRRARRAVRPGPAPRRSLGGLAALPDLGRRPPACAARAAHRRDRRALAIPRSPAVAMGVPVTKDSDA